jgi:hypothetical protein
MRGLVVGATLAFLAVDVAVGRKARKERAKPAADNARTSGGAVEQEAAEQEVMAWIQQKVGEGHNPEVLRAALGSVASGGTGTSSPYSGAGLSVASPRSCGLPKHAHSAAEDPRLREPLMSKDAVTSAWGWYSGSLNKPAVS